MLARLSVGPRPPSLPWRTRKTADEPGEIIGDLHRHLLVAFLDNLRCRRLDQAYHGVSTGLRHGRFADDEALDSAQEPRLGFAADGREAGGAIVAQQDSRDATLLPHIKQIGSRSGDVKLNGTGLTRGPGLFRRLCRDLSVGIYHLLGTRHQHL